MSCNERCRVKVDNDERAGFYLGRTNKFSITVAKYYTSLLILCE